MLTAIVLGIVAFGAVYLFLNRNAPARRQGGSSGDSGGDDDGGDGGDD